MAGLTIQHNLASMQAKNKMKKNIAGLKKSSEKLSSGYKINRAGDNASGLAVSEKMRSQIRGLSQAVDNAKDGISLIQTAEGGLNETHEILQRMRELTVQASNGTYAQTDREAIQLEIDALKSELNRISEGTEFNGTKLLDGSLGFGFKNGMTVDDSGLYGIYGARYGVSKGTNIPTLTHSSITSKPTISETSKIPDADFVNVGDFKIYGNPNNYSYDNDTKTLTIKGNVTVEGTRRVTNNKIVVAKDADAEVTLKNVIIDVSASSGCAFKVEDDSTGNVKLNIEGDSRFKSGGDYAGIQKNGSAGSLTINGRGQLIAESTGDGAGIGSEKSKNTAGIVINMNETSSVFATAKSGAGIGGGANGSGNVTISNGKVNATSETGAGIGGGASSSGEVTISSGKVTAISKTGAGIGGGVSGSGSVTISSGEVNVSSGTGAGIGGGANSSGSVTISNGEVEAVSENGAGIGGGIGGNATVTITGGNVTGRSVGVTTIDSNSVSSAGIGAGGGASGSAGTATVNISGRNTMVYAQSASEGDAEDIGAGTNGTATLNVDTTDLYTSIRQVSFEYPTGITVIRGKDVPIDPHLYQSPLDYYGPDKNAYGTSMGFFFAPQYKVIGQNINTEYGGGNTDYFKIKLTGEDNTQKNLIFDENTRYDSIVFNPPRGALNDRDYEDYDHFEIKATYTLPGTDVKINLTQYADRRREYMTNRDGSIYYDNSGNKIMSGAFWDLSYSLSVADGGANDYKIKSADINLLQDTIWMNDSNERYYTPDSNKKPINHEKIYEGDDIIDSLSVYYAGANTDSFKNATHKIVFDKTDSGPDKLLLGLWPKERNPNNSERNEGQLQTISEGDDLAYKLYWNERKPDNNGEIKIVAGSRGMMSANADQIIPKPTPVPPLPPPLPSPLPTQNQEQNTNILEIISIVDPNPPENNFAHVISNVAGVEIIAVNGASGEDGENACWDESGKTLTLNLVAGKSYTQSDIDKVIDNATNQKGEINAPAKVKMILDNGFYIQGTEDWESGKTVPGIRADSGNVNLSEILISGTSANDRYADTIRLTANTYGDDERQIDLFVDVAAGEEYVEFTDDALRFEQMGKKAGLTKLHLATGVEYTEEDIEKILAKAGFDYNVTLFDKASPDGDKTLFAQTVNAAPISLELKRGQGLGKDKILQTGEVLTLQIGANGVEDQQVALRIDDMSASALKVDTVVIEPLELALKSIGNVDYAIKTVSSQRAGLGAMQNRLEYTVSNLMNSSENLTAAESLIRDTNMAAEMIGFTKSNILQQASQAVMAQANQQPESILQLLGNQ